MGAGRPHGDLNPGFQIESLASWPARRWGHTTTGLALWRRVTESAVIPIGCTKPCGPHRSFYRLSGCQLSSCRRVRANSVNSPLITAPPNREASRPTTTHTMRSSTTEGFIRLNEQYHRIGELQMGARDRDRTDRILITKEVPHH